MVLSGVGGASGGRLEAVGRIDNDDGVPSLSFASLSSSVDEGVGSVRLELNLSQSLEVESVFDYEISGLSTSHYFESECRSRS